MPSMTSSDAHDLVFRAIGLLQDYAVDGRATYITGHTAQNPDGSVTVAFRNKAGKRTAQFKVTTIEDAKLCCKIMRQQTRRI